MKKISIINNPILKLAAVSSGQSPVITDIIVSIPSSSIAVGDRYIASAESKAAGLGGFFINLGAAGTAFMPANKAPADLRIGDKFLAEIIKPERQGKRPAAKFLEHSNGRVGLVQKYDEFTEKLPALMDKYLPKVVQLTKREDIKLIRSAAAEAGLDNSAVFDPEIIISASLDIDLFSIISRNKGDLVIDEAEAFTFIDVNAGTSNIPAVQHNLEIAEQLLAEIILTDIQGAILVDFIGMPDSAENKSQNKSQNKFLRDLKKLGFTAENRISLHGLTTLGILEMTRTRRGLSIREKLTSENIHASMVYEELQKILESSDHLGCRAKVCADSAVIEKLMPHFSIRDVDFTEIPSSPSIKIL